MSCSNKLHGGRKGKFVNRKTGKKCKKSKRKTVKKSKRKTSKRKTFITRLFNL